MNVDDKVFVVLFDGDWVLFVFVGGKFVYQIGCVRKVIVWFICMLIFWGGVILSWQLLILMLFLMIQWQCLKWWLVKVLSVVGMLFFVWLSLFVRISVFFIVMFVLFVRCGVVVWVVLLIRMIWLMCYGVGCRLYLNGCWMIEDFGLMLLCIVVIGLLKLVISVCKCLGCLLVGMCCEVGLGLSRKVQILVLEQGMIFLMMVWLKKNFVWFILGGCGVMMCQFICLVQIGVVGLGNIIDCIFEQILLVVMSRLYLFELLLVKCMLMLLLFCLMFLIESLSCIVVLSCLILFDMIW